MRELTIRLEGKEYGIKLENEFAKVVEKELQEQGMLENQIKAKDMLFMYLKKAQECFELQKKMQELIQRCENLSNM